MLNVARSAEQLETLRFDAVNPSFFVTAGKGEVGEPRRASDRLWTVFRCRGDLP
jgi:hypothetical protein